ncbi:MAG: hypothetical protein WB697_19520 [Stellaceae bacterium]
MAQSQDPDQIIIEVPPGRAQHVTVVEKPTTNADVTIRVRRERKSVNPIHVGVITK